MGYSLRYQALLDLPLRFRNNIPNITSPHQMLHTVFTLPRIPCPSVENIRFDHWCHSHLLGHNNGKPHRND